jgi:hypothetical protein
MSNFSAESYFATQPAPPNLEELLSGVRDFIDKHSQAGKRLVLVTVRRLARALRLLVSRCKFVEWWDYRTIGAECVSEGSLFLFDQ